MAPELRWRSAATSAAGPALAVLAGLLGGRAAGLTGIAAVAPALVIAAGRGLPLVGVGPASGFIVAAAAAVGLATVAPLPEAALLGALCVGAAWWGARLPPQGAAGLVALLAVALTAAIHPWHPAGGAVVALLVQAACGAAAGLAAAAAPASAAALGLGAAAAGLAGLPAAGWLTGATLCAAVLAGPWTDGEGVLAVGAAGALAGLARGAPGFGVLFGAAAGAAAGLWRRGPAWGRPAAVAAAALAASAAFAPGLWGWAGGALCAATAAALRPAARVPARAPAQPPASAAPAAVPAGLPERLQAFALACVDLGRGLAEVHAGQGLQEGERDLALAEQVCPGCPALAACWERKVPRARRMVSELWRAAAAGPVSWQQVGGADTIFCLRPREMAEAANRQAALLRQRQDFQALLAASRRTAVVPLIALGRQLAALAAEAAAAEAPLLEAEAPRQAAEHWVAAPVDGRLGYDCGAARLARPGRGTSGDSVRCRMLRGDRLALALSDGMGSGEPAALASAGAVEHLLAALAAGRSAADALGQTNAQLLADGGSERFATIDLALLHLRSGLVEWHKMGAAGSFVVQGRRVRQVGGGGLPAGILAVPEIRSGRVRLRPGDALVLVSDGVVDRPAPLAPRVAGTRTGWAAVWLREAPAAAPAAAAALLDAALRRVPGGEHDDLSVVVCRLAGTALPEEGGDGGRVAAGAGAAGGL